jgi:hypothetical protein
VQGKLKERDHSEELEVDGRIIIKCILHKSNGRLCVGLFWLRIGELERFCKDDNELSGFVKYVEFLTD